MLIAKSKKFVFMSFFLISFSSVSHASGVLPETSVVMINEESGGGSINVKNTENTPVLLYSKITELADDKTPKVIVTQPIARIEAGQSQRVRFLLNSNGALKTEHIKRVSFEGIPANTPGSNNVTVTVKQDLPMIIVPKGLSPKTDAWTDLNWSVKENKLAVTNTGPYVVRLQPEIRSIPGNLSATLRKPYILPGETLPVERKTEGDWVNQNSVVILPVTRYGMSAGEQTQTLN